MSVPFSINTSSSRPRFRRLHTAKGQSNEQCSHVRKTHLCEIDPHNQRAAVAVGDVFAVKQVVDQDFEHISTGALRRELQVLFFPRHIPKAQFLVHVHASLAGLETDESSGVGLGATVYCNSSPKTISAWVFLFGVLVCCCV